MNNEQRKKLLSADAEMYETMLEAEVNNTKEVLKKGVIIAGILTAGYTFSRLLTSSDEKPKEEESKSGNSNFTKLALGIITPIALKFAQEKLANLFAETTTDETDAT